jgi:arylsulfatase A-like enzyme
VFILADDMGYGDLGVTTQNARAAAGLPSFATPNIDALAASGMRFTQMYAGAPVCSASRNVLLTGFHEGHTVFDTASLDIDIRGGNQDETWGQVLQNAGYNTAMMGKWHLGGVTNSVRTYSALPTQKGFATVHGSLTGGYRRDFVWDQDGLGGVKKTTVPLDLSYTGPGPQRVYTEDLMASNAVQFIRNAAQDSAPFAAYFAFNTPHAPLNEVPQDHPYVNMPWPQAQKDYAGMIWRLDQHVGQIMSALNDPNGDGNTQDSIANNTMVIFTSDNGPLYNDPTSGYQTEFFDSNSIYSSYKSSTLEGGIRIPFMVSWPGVVQPGTVNDSYVGTFADILPTFAELTGQDVPLGVDGHSILNAFTGGQVTPPDATVWSFPQDFSNYQFNRWAVRLGDWKLVKYRPTNTFTLYNMANDPTESNDLAAARPDIKNALETIAIAEGMDREPSIPWDQNPAVQVYQNTYFTQYKAWAPQAGSTDFFSATNWSGGTQYGTPGDPEAVNWNTGPADNWLATLANQSATAQQLTLNADAQVLAIEIRGDAADMTLVVPAGYRLTARNGIRLSAGGRLVVSGGELNTIRDLDIRAGSVLSGSGVITGQQQVIAGIPEFANQGLFQPNVINAGELQVGGALAGILNIQGDYQQHTGGELRIDLFGSGGAAGTDFDKLIVDGTAQLSGRLDITDSIGFEPNLGDVFQILAAGKTLTGTFDQIVAPALSAGKNWAIQYTPQGILLSVVNQLPGDFDHNGIVNNNDLNAWKAAYGVSLDGSAFLAWQRELGMMLIVSTAATNHIIPEPAAATLAALATGVVIAGFSRPGRPRYTRWNC